MKISRFLFLSIFAFLLLLVVCKQQVEVVFSPGEVMPDTDGVPVNAHGAGFLIYNDTYYMFGEHKGSGNAGYVANDGVRCYSSKNLKDWKDEGIALAVVDDESSDIAKGCILERPKVIYNEKTGKFVMWFHLELKGQGYVAARTALAVADKVTGPYTFVKSLRPCAGVWPLNFSEEQKNAEYDYAMDRWTDEGTVAVVNGMYVKRDFEGGQMSRDMTLWVDDDGKAYHIAASEENGTLHICELTDDYMDFTGKYVRVFPDANNEAPAIFKYNDKYYMISSGCTGWNPNAARLSVADSIMGEWKYLGNPCRGEKRQINTTFYSQSTYIIPVIGKENAFIYWGDRWKSSNLIDSRYIMLPILFEDGQPVLRWYDEWTMDVFE